jgi:hypothetical protein
MLNMSNPFSPLGSTAPISVTTSSANTALGADPIGQAVYIANSGPAIAFVLLTDDAAGTVTTTTGIAIPPSPAPPVILSRSPAQTRLAAITAAAAATLYVKTGNAGN